jgi:endonuclease/exonuclease/phosphatase family metal-dependent hydrolase
MVLLAPAVGTAAGKKHKKKKDPQVTVMTRNLYLGADLGPAVSATTICGAIDAGGTILNDVDASNFPERAKLLADEIAKAKPDLLGLQEAALWRDQDTSDFTATPATRVRYDFLQELQDELAARNADYTVAVVQDEFDQELPANTDHNLETGNGPFGGSTGPTGCGADKDGRLTMRDAILVRKGSKVKVSNPQMGQFQNLYQVNLGGALPISVKRGWVSVDAKVKGSKKIRGTKFHFVDTHLESFGDPAIREAQARELFADGGPLVTKKQVIAVGDFNSGGPEDKVGPPFTTAGDEGAYNALTQDFGMTNLGTRQTCCYPDVFQPIIGDYRFDHTVDHVFAKPKVKQMKAYVTGNDPSVTGPGGVVASDHGGLVSRLKLKKK